MLCTVFFASTAANFLVTLHTRKQTGGGVGFVAPPPSPSLYVFTLPHVYLGGCGLAFAAAAPNCRQRQRGRVASPSREVPRARERGGEMKLRRRLGRERGGELGKATIPPRLSLSLSPFCAPLLYTRTLTRNFADKCRNIS